MCVDFVKQTNGHMNAIKRNYELGYQQCTNDVTTFLNKTPEVPFLERQQLLNQLSTASNRRYQPYRQPKSHHSVVSDWFNRCGGKEKSLPDSSSERSNTSSPSSSSFDDHSERSSSLWRPWWNFSPSLFLFVVYLLFRNISIERKNNATFPPITEIPLVHFILIAGVPHVYVCLLNRRHVNPLSEDVRDIIITFSSAFFKRSIASARTRHWQASILFFFLIMFCMFRWLHDNYLPNNIDWIETREASSISLFVYAYVLSLTLEQSSY